MTGQEEFAARLARIQSGTGDNTMRTIFVGSDERHVIERPAQHRPDKRHEIASNSLYPLSLVGAFALGLVAAAIGLYARFHLMSGREVLTEDADLEMAMSIGVGMMLSFVLAQLFRLKSKEHLSLQGVGVFAMACFFHNFAHWTPGVMGTLFSPDYVAQIRAEAPPNSVRFRGLYFPLFEGGQTEFAAVTAVPAAQLSTTCSGAGAEKMPGPEVLQTANAGKVSEKGGRKTLSVADQAASACP